MVAMNFLKQELEYLIASCLFAIAYLDVMEVYVTWNCLT